MSKIRTLKDDIILACDTVLAECPVERVENVTRYLAVSDMRDIEKQIQNETGTISMETIVELNRKIKKSLASLRRSEAKWLQNMESALFLEDVIKTEHTPTGEWRIRSPVRDEATGTWEKFQQGVEYLWYVKFHRVIYIFIAFSTAALSVIIVIGEVLIIIRGNDKVKPEDSIAARVFSYFPYGIQVATSPNN